MNKRLLCLLLSLIMLMSVVLTGCSNTTDDEAMANVTDEASKSTVTLTMYLMSDGEVSEEQAQKIEDAASKITKSKFKAKLELRYFTEEQYTTALEVAFKKTEDEIAAKKAAEQALKEAIKKGEATAAPETEAVSSEEETIITEYGTTELKYPPVSAHQIDIFYLEGFDTLMTAIENKRLSLLDEQMTGYAKLLEDYLVSDYLEYAEDITGGTYMIPNNTVMGEYTYLLLKKDVLEKYNYAKTDSFTSLTCDNVADILDKVSRYDTQYRPLWSGTGELDMTNVGYIGLDANNNFSHNFSIFGGTHTAGAKYGVTNNIYPCNSIFSDSSYVSQLSKLISYREKGYYGAENDTREFAVGLVKGDATLPEQYSEEYEVVVISNPKITNEDVFASGFAVSSYTSSVSRSMDVITYLNTNEDFRNLILYGIEGENYEIIENDIDGTIYKTVRRLNENYMMSAEKTGNAIIAYPIDGVERADIRDYQKIQNRDAEPVLDFGFYRTYSKETINFTAMAEIRELSEQVYEKIMACKTVEEFNTFVNGYVDPNNEENNIIGIKQQISDNDTITLMLNLAYSSKSENYEDNVELYGEGCSFGFLYMKWLEDMGYYNPMG